MMSPPTAKSAKTKVLTPDPIAKFPFSNLNPSAFLQAFLNEMMRVCDQHGLNRRDELIEQIGLNAGENFESAYRYEFGLTNPLDAEQYANLILGIKNHIGGHFSLASSTKDCIRVVNTRCPFGERVKDFPELCHMTSSVFGGIAARSFGYAKVELKKRIATHDGMCEVCIHTNPQEASKFAGTEYRRDAVPAIKPLACDTRHRVEERMRTVWCPIGESGVRQMELERATIVAHSSSMHEILLAIEKVAPTLATVLITGETGVGKEVVARALHALSERRNKPFVAVNCGAIPETLIESTLFGHEKGAFTGAHEVHYGLFHRAEGGTLFLDEVNSLSLATQVKLLRVLQEGEYERVGGNHTLTADVRIAAASNFPLDEAMKRGEFRKDLYYRLNVVHVIVPPLRDRPDDIPPLVDHLLRKLRNKHHKPIHAVSPRVMTQLSRYHWPGNIRELENVLERSFVFAAGSRIEQVELPKQSGIQNGSSNEPATSWAEIKSQAVEEIEKRHLELALKRFHGKVTDVAKWMELTPRAVYQKLTKYRLHPAAYREV
jgi:DNA-binding NtrC family response regulator